MAGGRCLLARAELAHYVAKLRESTSAQKAGTLLKAGYLASAKTVARNDLGNAAFGGLEYLVTRPTAVALDYLQSVARSAATGGTVAPHEFRTMANTLTREGFRQGGAGLRDGIAKAVQLLRTGVDPEQMAQRFEHEPTTFKNPMVDRVVNGVFNVMEANDKPFFQFALKTSLYGRAKLLAIREGLTGDALRARTNALLASPTEEMLLGAMDDAQYATFKNETAASRYLSGGRRALRQAANQGSLGAKAAGLATDIVLPFTKVPSAILKAGADYSPVGFAESILHAARGDGNRALLSASRAGVGTALMLAGYALAKQGKVTGMRPAASAERAQNDVENKPSNSVQINGRWHSVLFLGPLAIPFLVGANLHGMGSDGPAEMATDAGLSMLKTTTEQSYLQGLSNVLDALNDPSGRGTSAISGLLPVPSIVSQTAAALDPVQRQGETVGERLRAKLPIVSRSLEPRLTQFGDTARRNDGGLRGAAESFLDITNSRPGQSDAVTAEMDRLGVKVNSFGRMLKLPGQQATRRKPSEYNALLAEFGPVKRAALADLITSPDYRDATDEERRDMLEEELRNVQKVGNDVTKERRLGVQTPRVTAQRYLEGDF